MSDGLLYLGHASDGVNESAVRATHSEVI